LKWKTDNLTDPGLDLNFWSVVDWQFGRCNINYEYLKRSSQFHCQLTGNMLISHACIFILQAFYNY
jgi:hypothetical protein